MPTSAFRLHCSATGGGVGYRLAFQQLEPCAKCSVFQAHDVTDRAGNCIRTGGPEALICNAA